MEDGVVVDGAVVGVELWCLIADEGDSTQEQIGVGVERYDSFFFFFVYSYSHATYIDHGGVHFSRFSRPRSAQGGSLQAPLVPSARPLPKSYCAPRK